jgi:hypothetical protein
MSKKFSWLSLLLVGILLSVSGCGSASFQVGIEPAAEAESDLQDLPASAPEEGQAALVASSDEVVADVSEEADPPAEPAEPAVTGVEYDAEGGGVYTNAEYGFRFSFPTGWTLTETPGQEMPEESGFDQGPSIQLTKDDILLFIGYRHAGEQVIWWTGVGAFGDEIPLGPLTFLGQEVMQDALGIDGQVKFVSYSAVGGGQLGAGGLEFGIRLDDMSQVPFEELEIPSEIVAEAASILSSFELLP